MAADLTFCMIEMKNYGKTKKSRAGFKDEHGQTYIPPLSAKRRSAWMQKMGISEAQQAIFAKSS
jgi:hypothetical protein